MAIKTVDEIVKEMINTLNIELPKVSNVENAEKVIYKALIKAFSYSKEPVKKQKKLRMALQLNLAEDKLQNIDEKYAKFLVENKWKSIAQSVLNEIKTPRPKSINDSLKDYIINTWHQEGVSPKYLRPTYFFSEVGLSLFAHYSMWTGVGVLPWFTFTFGNKIHDLLLNIEAELLSKELIEFEQDNPKEYSSLRNKTFDNLREILCLIDYIKRANSRPDATPEELDKEKSESYETIYSSCEEELIETLKKQTMTQFTRLNQGFTDDEVDKICRAHFNEMLKKNILLSGANSAIFAVKALFKSITSPLTGEPLHITASLVYRALQLAMIFIIAPVLLTLKIARSFVLEPLQYLLQTLIETTVNLALLIITTPLLAKQGMQNVWSWLAPAAETTSSNLNEPMAPRSPALYNLSFFEKKPTPGYLAWNNITTSPNEVMDATNSVSPIPKSPKVRGLFDDVDLEDASPRSPEVRGLFDDLDLEDAGARSPEVRGLFDDLDLDAAP